MPKQSCPNEYGFNDSFQLSNPIPVNDMKPLLKKLSEEHQGKIISTFFI
jgi:hypothetical protein